MSSSRVKRSRPSLLPYFGGGHSLLPFTLGIFPMVGVWLGGEGYISVEPPSNTIVVGEERGKSGSSRAEGGWR